jgi:hypothetical protein
MLVRPLSSVDVMCKYRKLIFSTRHSAHAVKWHSVNAVFLVAACITPRSLCHTNGLCRDGTSRIQEDILPHIVGIGIDAPAPCTQVLAKVVRVLQNRIAKNLVRTGLSPAATFAQDKESEFAPANRSSVNTYLKHRRHYGDFRQVPRGKVNVEIVGVAKHERAFFEIRHVPLRYVANKANGQFYRGERVGKAF